MIPAPPRVWPRILPPTMPPPPEAEQERRAEAFREQRQREEQEYEAEQTRKEEQRKVRAATFERILENAPATFTASQLRVLLRALVNLDPYTFADDLAEDIAGDTRTNIAAPKRYCFPASTLPQTTS